MNLLWRLVNAPTPREIPPPAIPPIVLPNGETLAVEIRRSARARRIALRLHPSTARVELVIPADSPLKKALEFLRTREGWIVAQAAKIPPQIPFVAGAAIPVLGVPHRIEPAGPATGRQPPFRIADGIIAVTGAPEHLARRTRTGLARHAAALLTDKTAAIAARAGHTVGRITVGDARTRWGSCAASGNIKYSWRLVLAPEPVMDYVVAHEVAHLAEMNHSARFWRVVAALRPSYEAERNWLKRNGAQLLRYG